MADTLLSIAQAASEELLYDAPQSIFGNDDADAILLKRFASQVCKELIRDYSWQALIKTYTFTTVDGTSAYDLPSDYRSPISLTFWNRTNHIPMIAVSNAEWQTLLSGIVIAGVQYRFTVQGNKLNLSPTPPDNIEIAFNYYSNAFCEDGDTGEAKDDFSTDGDICRLDGDLVIRGVKWRFAQRKGLPYAEYKADYMAAIDALQGIDTPKDVINLTGCRKVRTNIPDTGYGQ